MRLCGFPVVLERCQVLFIDVYRFLYALVLRNAVRYRFQTAYACVLVGWLVAREFQTAEVYQPLCLAYELVYRRLRLFRLCAGRRLRGEFGLHILYFGGDRNGIHLPQGFILPGQGHDFRNHRFPRRRIVALVQALLHRLYLFSEFLTGGLWHGYLHPVDALIAFVFHWLQEVTSLSYHGGTPHGRAFTVVVVGGLPERECHSPGTRRMKFHMSRRRRELQRQCGAFFRLKTLRHVVVPVGNRCYLCRSLHKVADCLTGLCPAVQNAAGFRPACDFTRKVRLRPVRACAYAVQCPARYAVSLGAYPFLQSLVHVCERRDGKKTDGVVYTRGSQLPVAYLFRKIVADRLRGGFVRMVLRPVILVVAAFYLDAVQRICVAHMASVRIWRYAVRVAVGFRNATQNRHRRLRIQRLQELYVYVAVHRYQRICK